MPGFSIETVSRASAGAATDNNATAAVPAATLHIRVIGTAASLGCDPVDVLGWVLDVSGLTVDAVLGIDLKPGLTVRILDELIDGCRTITLFRPVVERQIDVHGYGRVF